MKSANGNQRVYFFAAGESEGHAGMKDLLGGKGANLAEMTALGFPVPPGFTISTEMCLVFNEQGQTIPDFLRQDVLKSLGRVEKIMGKRFGDPQNPLLVSVRSGARASMPGMMDTILNLGLNDLTVAGLTQVSGQARFAWDSYRRFIQMYSHVVMNMNGNLLEVILEDLKEEKRYKSDTELNESDLKFLVSKFKTMVAESTGKRFPEDPFEQLWGAIGAVFKSWNTPRAITYRKLHSIPESWGTAVNVQSMVFGNRGEDCATGVAFTRDPSTGEKVFFGEYLINAQGEDVVAGIRTPHPITRSQSRDGLVSLEEAMPKVFQELETVYKKLEHHYRDMQDIEFTVENGKLWMLQTRTGKRTTQAALKIAIDMVNEKLITPEEAVLRIDPRSLDQLLHPRLDPNEPKTLLTKGLPASPGGVSGQVVFSSEEAAEWKENGKKVILVRIETSPEDIHGMVASQGILTTRGGMTSHAAVVARGMGKCCVAGSGEIDVDYDQQVFRVRNFVVKKGDLITLDGSTGEVFLGAVKTIEPTVVGAFSELMDIAARFARLGVRANADSPKDAEVARKFGAAGIGLCRTEHMFFGEDRITAVREMIIADAKEERKRALQKLLPMQREDFVGIFRAMGDYPVTIRLLDPPLHEFVPQQDGEVRELALRLGISFEKLRTRVRSLHEFNPMLGHRGCRLAVTYPEIYDVQVRAIAEAASILVKEGKVVVPEIMIPLVGTAKELDILRQSAEEQLKLVQKEQGVEFAYLIGTMIELPRAAVTADEIASHADFFSFGTNDLTQTTLGLSRDDAGRFLDTYVSRGIFEDDPFVSLDQGGVGKLVKMGVDLGRATRPKLKVGICGEHGGDPRSIGFFHRVGMDYVSCSPYRVPIARLAAAQAALEQKVGVGTEFEN